MKICKKGHEYDENRKQCPVCKSKANKKHYEANRADILAEKKRDRQQNPEKHEQRDREQYHRDRHRRSIKRAEKYWSDPERYREESRRYAKAHPEKARASTNRRRARLAGVPQDGLVYELDPFCAVCYVTENLTEEHLVAISRGGSDTLGNKATFCLSCNSSKRNMNITDPEFTTWLVRRRLTV